MIENDRIVKQNFPASFPAQDSLKETNLKKHGNHVWRNH